MASTGSTKKEVAGDVSGSTAISLHPVPAPPRKTFIHSLIALGLMPPLMVLVVIANAFVKDAEAFVTNLFPLRVRQMLRDTPLTWSLFSTVNFAIAALVAAVTRPRLCRLFFASHGVTRVSYGPSPWQRMTIFRKAKQQRQPLVLFVHGGVWTHSRDWNYRLIGRRLHSEGFIAVILGYRLFPEKCVPDQARDVCSALAWLRDNADKFGVDTSRMALLGHSSGGHLCATAALAGEGANLACVATVGSPFDIPDHYDFESKRGVASMSPLHPACGGEINFARLSPTRFMESMASNAAWDASSVPPFFLGHGSDDTVVPTTQAEKFDTALKRAGVTEAEVQLWPGVGHSEVILNLMGMPVSAAAEAATESLLEFLRRKLWPALTDARHEASA